MTVTYVTTGTIMVKDIIQGVISPITDIFTAREQRKAARESATAKLKQANAENDYNIQLSDQEWEQVAAKTNENTWKDEYVTISVVSILNIIVVGGIATAFGYPQVLEGISLAIQALIAAGVDFGFIMNATILAGLGLSVWRRF